MVSNHIKTIYMDFLEISTVYKLIIIKQLEWVGILDESCGRVFVTKKLMLYTIKW
jgi:hypothetical protein